MKCCILMGSPRKNGNTISLVKPFAAELEQRGWEWNLTWLYDKNIAPCTACRACQQDWTKVGCCQSDDMLFLFEEILSCDLLILATPIYSWYCTPPMKAALDRLVYGMNKYYGQEMGPALWEGKPVALITTCGYRPEQGADLWEAGIKRYCRHSKLHYMGMLAERHKSYKAAFINEEKKRRAAGFAREIIENTGMKNIDKSKKTVHAD